MSGRFRQGLLLIVQIALMLALCGLVLVLAERYNVRYDLTPQKTFVISDQSKSVANSLREPVHIILFFNAQESGQRRQISDVLDQFTAVTPNISYDLYDLDRTPGLAKKYNISSYNTGVIESRGQTQALEGPDEVEVTSALLKLSRGQSRALCFLIGHGEHNPETIDDRNGYSDVAKALERESFAIRIFDVTPSQQDLAKCTVLVTAGPTRELFGNETERLAAFLDGGGKMFVLVDPDAPPSLVAFLAQFGVRASNDLVVDERNRLYGADAFMPRIPIFDRETFHKNLETAAVFSLARTVIPIDPPPNGVKVALVALSSPDSWARVDSGTPTETTPKFRQEVDQPGPLPVALLVTVDRSASTDATRPIGRLAVFGDADFASNFYLNLMGNKDLFMSMIGVLAEDNELVAVRQKGLPKGTLSPIYLTAMQGRMIFWLSVVIVPGAALLIGSAVAYRRRRKGS